MMDDVKVADAWAFPSVRDVFYASKMFFIRSV